MLIPKRWRNMVLAAVICILLILGMLRNTQHVQKVVSEIDSIDFTSSSLLSSPPSVSTRAVLNATNDTSSELALSPKSYGTSTTIRSNMTTVTVPNERLEDYTRSHAEMGTLQENDTIAPAKFAKSAQSDANTTNATVTQNHSTTTTATTPQDKFRFDYYMIPNETDTSSSAAEICFIKSAYSSSIENVDKVDNPAFGVTQMRKQNPSFRFYLFTNLPELQPAPGWTKIIISPNLPYKRYITHSRYGKFMAWVLPEIQNNCDVVFYGDGIVQIANQPAVLRQYARLILEESKFGLMQLHHPKSSLVVRMKPGQENDNTTTTTTTTTYGPLDEFSQIRKGRKDIEKNIKASIDWLQKQNDFTNDDTPMYHNAYFGYDPKNPYFQAVSLDFWQRYSLEVDSWRDQPLWSYMLKHHNITPTLFPEGHGRIFQRKHSLRGHGKHRYNAKSNADAV